MTEPGLVDWTLAQRIAVGLAGDGGSSGSFGQRTVDSACADAVTLVTEYTGMRPGGPLPAPELIDRAEWARLGVRSLRELSGGLERSIADGIRLPGPLAGVARSLAGAAAAAEAGVAVGYGARKVLGQYDIALAGADRAARLVFVGPEPRVSARASSARTPSSSCAGSRSTRPPTRSSSARCPGSDPTWWNCSTGCSRAPRAGSTTHR